MTKTAKLLGITMLILCAFCIMTMLVSSFTPVALAEESGSTSTVENNNTESSEKTAKAIAAAVVVGIVATGGAIAMGHAIAKSNESTARQPEAGGQIRTGLMLGLVFIETAIIYALIVAILIIFVL